MAVGIARYYSYSGMAAVVPLLNLTNSGSGSDAIYKVAVAHLWLQLAKMRAPAGLLAITTAIVLHANSTVTKRAHKFYLHNVHYLAIQRITQAMLT